MQKLSKQKHQIVLAGNAPLACYMQIGVQFAKHSPNPAILNRRLQQWELCQVQVPANNYHWLEYLDEIVEDGFASGNFLFIFVSLNPIYCLSADHKDQIQHSLQNQVRQFLTLKTRTVTVLDSTKMHDFNEYFRNIIQKYRGKNLAMSTAGPVGLAFLMGSSFVRNHFDNVTFFELVQGSYVPADFGS